MAVFGFPSCRQLPMPFWKSFYTFGSFLFLKKDRCCVPNVVCDGTAAAPGLAAAAAGVGGAGLAGAAVPWVREGHRLPGRGWGGGWI